MKLPEQYKNLNANEKRTIVSNLVNKYWYEKTPEIVNNFTDEQVDFLFNYIFTESKEEREKMWNNMQKKYETTIKNLKVIAERLQKLDLQFAELLAQREDTCEFMKNIK